MSTLYERTARQALRNQHLTPDGEIPNMLDEWVVQERALTEADTRLLFVSPAELELVVLALGLLLCPAAATLQARLAGLRP
jgi:hypothetical protein